MSETLGRELYGPLAAGGGVVTIFGLAGLPGAVATTQAYLLEHFQDTNEPRSSLAIALASACTLLALFAAIPFCRVLCRDCPIRMSGSVVQARWGVLEVLLKTLLPVAAAGIASVFWCAVFLSRTPLRVAINVYDFQLAKRQLGIGDVSLIVTWSAVATTAVLICLIHHHRFVVPAKRPYILYLRRFSSRSDLVLQEGLLKATPGALAIVMLVETSKDRTPFRVGGNWNPFTIGFVGASLRNLISSIPFYVQAGRLSWENSVAVLLKYATCVVIDETEASDALMRERDMIIRLDATTRTIPLVTVPKQCAGAEEQECLVMARGRYWYRQLVSVVTALTVLASFALIVSPICIFFATYQWELVMSMLMLTMVVVGYAIQFTSTTITNTSVARLHDKIVLLAQSECLKLPL